MAFRRPILTLLLLAVAACGRSPSAPTDTARASTPSPATADTADAAETAADGEAAEPDEAAATGGDATTADDATASGETTTGGLVEPEPLPVAVYRARGVGEDGLRAARAALRDDGGFDVREVSPGAVRRGALDDRRAVFFSGGIGSLQGGELEPEGRRLVREFVRAGGGYVGICAGAYLAIQGPPQYHHLAIVAARNWSEDAWRRGTAMLEVAPAGGGEPLRLFYANGPVFRRDEREGLPPWVALATYVDDKFCESCGTRAGELPGTPAILAASYGAGRIVLFSPNPTLARGEEPARPELFLAAMRWVSAPGPVPADLTFAEVFGVR